MESSSRPSLFVGEYGPRGDPLEECREELQSTLEDWLLLGLQLGHKLPVVNGINLNQKASTREPAYAKAH